MSSRRFLFLFFSLAAPLSVGAAQARRAVTADTLHLGIETAVTMAVRQSDETRLAAAQLDVVSRVKRAYYALYFNQRAEAILGESRGLAEDLVERFGAVRSGTVALGHVRHGSPLRRCCCADVG